MTAQNLNLERAFTGAVLNNVQGLLLEYLIYFQS